MAVEAQVMTDQIECPLCLGEGTLKRTEILDRLGVRDFARVAQLSAEETFRLLTSKHKQDEQTLWSRFEAELNRRTSEMRGQHTSEVGTLSTRIKLLDAASSTAAAQVRAEFESKLQSERLERERAIRRAEDQQHEIEQLRAQNRGLEAELTKVARVGKREEIAFADEARSWAGIHIGDKLGKNGDFLLAFRDAAGNPVEPKVLIDCKDRDALTQTDLDKLIRDAKVHALTVAAIVMRDESQLRQSDRETRWAAFDGVWVLRSTREWLRRDLDVLRPLFERMRIHGADFLERNAHLAAEVRGTFTDIDRIQKELGKAAKSIQSVSGLVTKHRSRLESLCASAEPPKKAPKSESAMRYDPQKVA